MYMYIHIHTGKSSHAWRISFVLSSKVEDLQRGTVLPFAHGKQLPMEDRWRWGKTMP